MAEYTTTTPAAKTRLPEFDLLRKNVEASGVRAEQRAQEAIRRRFASLGGLKTGASLKAEGEALGNVRRATGEQLGNIGIAEASAARQIEESQKARDFARELETGRQEFASAETEKAREFQQRRTRTSSSRAASRCTAGRASSSPK